MAKLDEKQINQIPITQTSTIEKNNQLKNQKKSQLFKQAIVCALGSLYIGYALGSLNMAQNKLNIVYDIQDNNLDTYIGILNSSMLLGAFFGSIITGNYLSFLGRRQMLMIADISTIVFSLLFLIENFWAATAGRFFMGIIVGINSTIGPLYIREISTLQLQQITASLHQIFLSLGIFVGYLLGLGFPLDDDKLEQQNGFYWRFVLMFPIIPMSFRLVCFKFIYKQEHIIFQIIQQKEDLAKKQIEQIFVSKYQNQIFQSLQQEVQIKNQQDNTWASVFNKYYINKIILGCMLHFLLQFSGINAVIFYSNDIFNEILNDKQQTNIMTIMQGFFFVIFATFSTLITKKIGRRPIFLYGQIFLCLILALIGTITFITKDQNISTFLGIILMISIVLFVFGWSTSIGLLAWVYNAEIQNNEKGLGLVTSSNWLFGFIVGLICPILQEKIGVYFIFRLFSVSCLLGYFYLYIFVKETFQKTQQEIAQLFNKNLQNTQHITVEIEKIEKYENN